MNIGIDCQEIALFKGKIKENQYNLLFTKNELNNINKINDENRKFQRIVGYYCVKEALFKSMKLKNLELSFFSCVEVDYDDNGAPKINILSYNFFPQFKERIKKIDTSISHTGNICMSVCLIELI